MKLPCATVSLFILFFAGTCFSQNIEPATDRLDSLLLAEDFGNFLTSWKAAMDSGDADTLGSRGIMSYRWLPERLTRAANLSVEKAMELVGTYETSLTEASLRYRGKKANLAYKNYLAAEKTGRYRDALDDYFTLTFFGNRYLQSENQRLRTNCSTAIQLGAAGKYEEAGVLIEKFRNEDPAAPSMQAMGDSLRIFYNQLETSVKDQRVKMEYENTGSPVQKKLSISADVVPQKYAAIENTSWVMHHKTFGDMDLPFGNIPSEVNALYRVQLEYFMNTTLSLGGRVSLGKVHSVKLYFEGEDMKTSEDLFYYGVFGKYFLREKNGPRPYFALGAGIVNIKRGKIELSPSNFWYPEFTPASVFKKSYPQTEFEIGVEFEFGTSTPVFFGAYGLISYCFSDTNVIQPFNYGGGIRVGLNLF